MKSLFDQTSFHCSKLITNAYSTSFSIGTMLLDKRIRKHIYSIYGFVRYADEIVDTFHDYDKQYLLQKFKEDTYEAINRGISLNPILNSYQHTVNTYKIDIALVDSFLKSMEMDLDKANHDLKSYEEYIYGSAEVVGLMCLRVFTEGDEHTYKSLQKPALALGAAFQKVNFLRDMKQDVITLGRSYFPEIQLRSFDSVTKKEIEKDIENDFREAYKGILKLPKSSRLGVYVAFVYYNSLFRKICKTSPEGVMLKRIRIADPEKLFLLTQSYFRHSLSLV
jgi:phytoene synthase